MRWNGEREVENRVDFLLLEEWAFHIDDLLSDATDRKYLQSQPTHVPVNYFDALSSTCVVGYWLFLEASFPLSWSIWLYFSFSKKCGIVQNQCFISFAFFLLILLFWAPLVAYCNNVNLKKSIQFSSLFFENVLFLACLILSNTASSDAMK